MKKLKKAIDLRARNNLVQSNILLVELAKFHPDNAIINYQCAWSYDILGEEQNAIEYYEKALSLDLNDEDYLGAIVGCGSTYRCIGEYQKAKEVFEKGLLKFPEANSIKVFYAMTMYNLNEHHMAIKLLLNLVCNTTNDKEIIQYEKAIRNYAMDLEKTNN